MRFLIDAKLPRAAIVVCQKFGHQVEFARDIGLAAASDAQIAERARESGAALLTRDLDFADVRRYPPGIATSLVSEEPQWHSAGMNLADSLTKKTLTLVYFDRPCRLFGAVIAHPAAGGVRTDNYDVVIEKAGLSWLETTKVGEDSHLEVRLVPAAVRPLVKVQAKHKTV